MRVVHIVLAAGRSRRMGKPKALLDFDGRTALELIVHAGVDAGVDAVTVVVGHAAEEVRAAHSFGSLGVPVRWVTNDRPDAGQITSLQLALAVPETEPGAWFFFQPVDAPLASAEDCLLLLRAAERTEEEGARVIYLSHGHRRGHPVLCHESLRSRLLELEGDATARDVLATAPSIHVVTTNSGVLADLDTPSDYRAALRRYRDSL